jgi:hypothetical protein
MKADGFPNLLRVREVDVFPLDKWNGRPCDGFS